MCMRHLLFQVTVVYLLLLLCGSSMQCATAKERPCPQTIKGTAESSLNRQLVLYDPPRVLQPLHEKERRVWFGGYEWVIQQHWERVGAAAVIWEAALALCRYLEKLSSDFLSGKRVIELGAGTGLVGMVVHTLGASDVVITDKNTLPAEGNLQLNSHQLIPQRPVSVRQLNWGQDVSTFHPPYDIILAADVVYIEDTFPLLIKSLDDLSDLHTTVLLSCKYRYERDSQFLDMAKEVFTSEVVWSSGDLSIHSLRKKRRDGHNCTGSGDFVHGVCEEYV